MWNITQPQESVESINDDQSEQKSLFTEKQNLATNTRQISELEKLCENNMPRQLPQNAIETSDSQNENWYEEEIHPLSDTYILPLDSMLKVKVSVEESCEIYNCKYNQPLKKLMVSDPSQRDHVSVTLKGHLATIYNSIKKGDVLYIDNIMVTETAGVRRLESKKDETIIFGLQEMKKDTNIFNERQQFTHNLVCDVNNTSTIDDFQKSEMPADKEIKFINDGSNTKNVIACRIIEVYKISVYTGCTVHEYKVSKTGICKKCKGEALHKSKFFKSKFIISDIQASRLMN